MNREDLAIFSKVKEFLEYNKMTNTIYCLEAEM